MILLKSSEHQCLNEISARLPELLLAANINISVSSQNQLAEMIKSHVRFNYFPSGFDAFAKVIILPISLLMIAFSPYAVVIDSKCGNPELTNISYEKQKLLDELIFDRIFSRYRDYAREAEIANQHQERPYQVTIQEKVQPVLFSRASARRATSGIQTEMDSNYLTAREIFDKKRELRELQERLRKLENNSLPCPCVIL